MAKTHRTPETGTAPMRINLRLDSMPASVDDGLGEEYFAGFWSATQPLALSVSGAEADNCHIERGSNWSLVSSTFNDAGVRRSFCHHDPETGAAHLFRGYLVEPGIHSYSDHDDILKRFGDGFPLRPNGVFSYACIEKNGRSLAIVSDLLGMSPIYIRKIGALVCFASHVRLLGCYGDAPDITTWNAIVSYRAAFGDRTRNWQIERVGPAMSLKFSEQTKSERRWYDFDSIASPTRRIEQESIAEADEVLDKSVSRVSTLMPGQTVSLPLSGGMDSRRILAHCLNQEVNLESFTVRIPQADKIDTDSATAVGMAKKFGFKHDLVDLPKGTEFATLDSRRRWLLDSETTLHSWAAAMRPHFSKGIGVVLDGACGDVLSNPAADLRKPFNHADENLTQAILDQFVGEGIGMPVFAGGVKTQVQYREVESWLQKLPSAQRADLGFLLLRTRRSILLWSQRLLPAGKVAVYPFLDLDYFEQALSLDRRAKATLSLQIRCLEQCHADLMTFIPEHESDFLESESADYDNVADVRYCILSMLDEIRQSEDKQSAFVNMRAINRLRLELARRVPALCDRWAWWIQPALECLAAEATGAPALEVSG